MTYYTSFLIAACVAIHDFRRGLFLLALTWSVWGFLDGVDLLIRRCRRHHVPNPLTSVGLSVKVGSGRGAASATNKGADA